MDPTDLKQYTTILEEYKSLDINDFLHDVSLYVVNRPLPPQRAAFNSVSDSSCSTVVPRRCFVETDIFELEETARGRSSAPHEDTPLFGEGSRKFDQFGSMQGEMRRDLDVFATEVENPVTSSQGYQSHLGTHSGGLMHNKKKSRLQPFPEERETLDHATTGAPLMERDNEVGGGAQRSPSSWFGHSFPNHSSKAAFEPSSHHPEDDNNVGDEQPPTALSYSTEMEVDNLVATPQHVFGEVVLDKPPSLRTSTQPPSNSRTTQDDDVRQDVSDKKSKAKMEEKKKEPVFFKGVPLIDQDDCDVFDKRLHCNNDDSNDDDTPKLEDMDIGDGGAFSLQCLEPKASPAAEPLQSSVRVHNDHHSKAIPSSNDPLSNATGKAPHLDVVIVNQEAGWFQFWEEKCKRKTAEKLVLHQENERIMMERDDSWHTIAYLQELLQKQLGGNIDVLLLGNLKVPINEPTLFMPAPSIPRIPSIAFLVARGAFGSLSSPFVGSESLFPPKMLENFSYPRVKDNSLV